MSAFVVNSTTISNIVSLQWGNAADFNIDLATTYGKLLLELNVMAVTSRYGLEDGKYAQAIAEYVYSTPDVSDVQKFKSLACFTYQCAEEPVVSSPFFLSLCAFEEAKRLELAKGKTALQWGHLTPFIEGYAEAEWG